MMSLGIDVVLQRSNNVLNEILEGVAAKVSLMWSLMC